MPHAHDHDCAQDCDHSHDCDCGAEMPLLHLVDEDGHEADYPVLDVVPYGGDDYAILLDIDAPEQNAVMVLRIVPAFADEAERYEGVGDEALMYAVFEEFQRRCEGTEEAEEV